MDTPPATLPAHASAAPQPPTPDNRNNELRRAGAEYFDRVVAQSGAARGTIPLPGTPPPASASKRSERLDPDLIAFGKVLEGNKNALISALHAGAQAVHIVTLRHALLSLGAPLTLTALALAAAAALLWLARAHDFIDLPLLGLGQFRSAAVAAALHAAQLVFLAAALQRGSVFAVLAATCAAAMSLELWVALRLTGRAGGSSALLGRGRIAPLAGEAIGTDAAEQPGSLPRRLLKRRLAAARSAAGSSAALLGIAAAGAACAVLASPGGAALPLLASLGLWGGVEWVKLAWEHVRLDVGRYAPRIAAWGGPALESTLSEIALGQNLLSASQLAVLQQLVPLPVLAVLAALEWRLGKRTEVSVPSASAALFASAAYALAACARLFVSKAGDLKSQARLVGAPLAAAALLEVAVGDGWPGVFAALGALAAIGARVLHAVETYA